MASLASTSQASMMIIARSRTHLGSAQTMRAPRSLHRTYLTNSRRQCHGHAFSSRRRGSGLHTCAMMDEGELVPDVDEGTRVKITKEVGVWQLFWNFEEVISHLFALEFECTFASNCQSSNHRLDMLSMHRRPLLSCPSVSWD